MGFHWGMLFMLGMLFLLVVGLVGLVVYAAKGATMAVSPTEGSDG